MMLDEKQLQQLLKLKRFEQPPPGYFERALEEFHRRQRSEILRRSAFQIWFERVSSSFGNFRVPASAYAGAFGIFAVVATLLGTGIWTPEAVNRNSTNGLTQTEFSDSGLKLTSRGEIQLSRPETKFQKNFPTIQPSDASRPRYILDRQPVSYQPPASF
jgi:hypothetical protein